jgi:hypothetical protein
VTGPEDVMSRVRCCTLALVGACATVVAVGCGPGTVPVKGVVTYEDRPLGGAFVTFLPLEAGGQEAHGSTDAQGAFALSTPKVGPGALPGAYKVTVRYSEPARVPANLKGAAEVQKAIAESGAPAVPAILIGPNFADPDRTVLRHRVPDDGDAKLEVAGPKR